MLFNNFLTKLRFKFILIVVCEKLFSVAQKKITVKMRTAKYTFKRKPWHLTRVSGKFENDKCIQISNDFAITFFLWYNGGDDLNYAAP